MSTPKIETIAAAIQTKINTITTTAGYEQTLTCVRPKRFDWQDVAMLNNTVLLLQGDCTPRDQASQSNVTNYDQQFDAVAIVTEADDATTSIDTKINKVASDLIKALLADVTFGGYSTDCMITGIEIIGHNESGLTGVVVSFTILYRTTWGNPYS